MTQPTVEADRTPDAPIADVPAARAGFADGAVAAGARGGKPGVAAGRWNGVVAALALALALGALALVWMLARPLGFLLAALVIAEALSPAVARLERRLPRGLAIGAVYLLLVLGIAAILGLVTPPLVEQGRTLIDNGPALVAQGRGLLARFDQFGLGDLSGSLGAVAGRLGGALVALPLRIFSAVTALVLLLTMSAYWLLVKGALYRFALSLFPAGPRERVGATLSEMGQTMGGYVRAVALDGFALGVITYLGLAVIGVEYAVVLAVVTGLGALVPLVGPIATAIPPILIALLDSPVKALVVLIFYFVVQQIESNFILPNLMRRQSDIPALLVLFALFVGGSIGGILGALVAIPLAGAARVFIVRLVAPAIRGWTGAGVEAEG